MPESGCWMNMDKALQQNRPCAFGIKPELFPKSNVPAVREFSKASNNVRNVAQQRQCNTIAAKRAGQKPQRDVTLHAQVWLKWCMP